MTARPATVARPDPGRMGFEFSQSDFQIIARHAYDDFGLHLTEVKKELVYSRLIKRLRGLGLSTFRAYCELIESEAGAGERVHMLSALTTNVTHFFREGHHFRTLRETVLPPLIDGARKGRRIRLWSAGCSGGQEPYSLAMTVLELCPDAARLDIRILATDVDPTILTTARQGSYPNDELETIPEPLRKRYTLAGPDGSGAFTIDQKPRALITFGELNLMQDWPVRGPFDILFCRNVAIYFDKKTQARLWDRFADLLTPGGCLFIGHSERLAGPAETKVAGAGVTTYRKHSVLPAGNSEPPREGATRWA